MHPERAADSIEENAETSCACGLAEVHLHLLSFSLHWNVLITLRNYIREKEEEKRADNILGHANHLEFRKT